MSEWTEENLTTLFQCSAKNMTAREMMAHLPGFSRNAIIGKCHREKLSLSDKRLKGFGKPVQVKERRSVVERIKRVYEPKITITEQQRNEALFQMFNGAAGKMLLSERGSKQCAWPTGGEMLNPTVCGDDVKRGSYCGLHDRIAHKGGLRYA